MSAHDLAPGDPMIVVHHLNDSRSQRVLWLLEELEIPYRIERYQRDPKTMLAPPELKKIHPLGKSPVITDGDRTIAESGAIIEYLAEVHGGGRLVPAKGTDAHFRCRYWMHYAEGSAMPPLLLKLVFDRIKTTPVPFFVKPIVKQIADKALTSFVQPQLTLHLDHIERTLASSPWFAGDEMTIADIQMSFPLEAATARAGLDASCRPAAWKYVQKIHARPAYQRALAQGGPYSFAP
jgi:glutathione S-transferase